VQTLTGFFCAPEGARERCSVFLEGMARRRGVKTSARRRSLHVGVCVAPAPAQPAQARPPNVMAPSNMGIGSGFRDGPEAFGLACGGINHVKADDRPRSPSRGFDEPRTQPPRHLLDHRLHARGLTPA
jgi:hypothetical protein